MPHEGFRVVVPMLDPDFDGVDEGGNAAEHSSASIRSVSSMSWMRSFTTLQVRRDPKGGPTRAMICTDRDRPGVVLFIVEFPSEDAVAAGNADPVVNEISHKLAAITDGPPRFTDLDEQRVSD
jgi:hypothetical protein